MGTMEGSCRSKGAKISTKLRVYNVIVKPTPLYGRETWTLQNRHTKKLQVTEMRYLRRVEGVKRLNRMRSDDLRERLRQEDVLDSVLRKKKISKDSVQVDAWKETLTFLFSVHILATSCIGEELLYD